MAAVSSARQGADRDGPFQLRGNSFTMMVLKVNDPASPDFFTQLAVKVRQAPNFFRNAPVVLDFEELTEDTPRFDIAALVTNLRALYLLPVGFRGGPRAVHEGRSPPG